MRDLSFLVAFAGCALGCECVKPTACSLLEREILFVGEVISGGVDSLRENPWYAKHRVVRFRVLENFRGLPQGALTADVEIVPPEGMCAPVPYFQGRRYLVSPLRVNGALFELMCYSSVELSKLGTDLDVLREYFSGKMPTHLRGRVFASRESDVNYIEADRQPLPGVRVVAKSGKSRHTAVTGADGRYRLKVPAGDYQLNAKLASYPLWEGEAEVTVEQGGCADFDLSMGSGSTISGRVLDAGGKPVPGAQAGLIAWRDRAWDATTLRSSPAIYVASAAPEDGRFRFADVPLGEYLLVFNPDGPQSDRVADRPRARTYYPAGSSLANAKPIAVRRPGVRLTGLDLVAGPPVEQRTVSVRAEFPDGQPYGTAVVHCVGYATDGGDLPLARQKSPWTNREVTFAMPADRRIEITIKDGHGRDMKAEYRRVHPPGAAPIVEKFVIQP